MKCIKETNMKLIHNQQTDTLQINAITIPHLNDSNNKLEKII